MVVGFFSLAMFVLYVAFVPQARAQAIAEAAAARLASAARRLRRPADDAAQPDDEPAEPRHARHLAEDREAPGGVSVMSTPRTASSGRHSKP
jgi:hypothetical protein